MPRKSKRDRTLPKYLSSSSTYLWMISSVMSSLSWSSTAQQKYRLAYLQHINGVLSGQGQEHLCRMCMFFVVKNDGSQSAALVFWIHMKESSGYELSLIPRWLLILIIPDVLSSMWWPANKDVGHLIPHSHQAKSQTQDFRTDLESDPAPLGAHSNFEILNAWAETAQLWLKQKVFGCLRRERNDAALFPAADSQASSVAFAEPWQRGCATMWQQTPPLCLT